MQKIIQQMQCEKNGVPIRTVKSFMSKIPSVFTGKKMHVSKLFVFSLSLSLTMSIFIININFIDWL